MHFHSYQQNDEQSQTHSTKWIHCDQLQRSDSNAFDFDGLPRIKDLRDFLEREIDDNLARLDTILTAENASMRSNAVLLETREFLRRFRGNFTLLSGSINNFCIVVHSVRQMHAELQATHQKLNLQIEHSHRLESLLTDREWQVTNQTQELDDAESQLISSTRLVSALHDRLTISHSHLTQLLRQLHMYVQNFHSDANAGQFPSSPALLELAANLNSAYTELQESERLRIAAEQRLSSALITAPQLPFQLLQYGIKTSGFSGSRVETSTQTQQFSVTSAAVQAETCGEASRPPINDDRATCWQSGKLMPYVFSRPSDVLATFDSSDEHGLDQVTALSEALRNSLVQIERLNKYRLTQKAKLDQLQQRFAQMNSELDATVDALRHHQNSAENERRRTASELAGLRTQLAKANAVLAHQGALSYKMQTKNCDSNQYWENSHTISVGPQSIGAVDASASSFGNPLIELEMARSEVTQLRSEIAEQQVSSNRETTKLRGQMAELTADSRALRIQVVRLQSALAAAGRPSDVNAAVEGEQLCVNCQKLQRLLDILQEKQSKRPPASGHLSGAGSTASPELSNPECTDVSSRSHELSVGSLPNGTSAFDVEVQTELLWNHIPVYNKQELPMKEEERLLARVNIQVVTENMEAKTPISKLSSFSPLTGIPNDLSPPPTDSALIDPSVPNFTMSAGQLGTMEQSVNDKYTPGHFPVLQPDRMSDFEAPSIGLAYMGEEANEQVLDDPTTFPISQHKSAEELANELALLRVILHEERREIGRLKQCLLHKEDPYFCRTAHMQSLAMNGHDSSDGTTSVLLNELSHDQLIARVKAAEFEAKEAVDQLRASNAEFLTLRERLSHAAVERAHLKSTVEGLDEQVYQLETSLYERMVQLNHYRDELSKYDPKYTISPITRSSFRLPLVQRVDCSRLIKYISHGSCRAALFRRSSHLPIVQSAWILAPVSSANRHITSAKSFLCSRFSALTLTCVTRARLASLRSRLLLHSPPRPFVIVAFIAYFLLLHMFVLRCYLF